MTDRTTKVILGFIAVGLWANVIGAAVRPAPVTAQTEHEVNLAYHVRVIENLLLSVVEGKCDNPKIC